jgi:hypothetical protein
MSQWLANVCFVASYHVIRVRPQDFSAAERWRHIVCSWTYVEGLPARPPRVGMYGRKEEALATRLRVPAPQDRLE